MRVEAPCYARLECGPKFAWQGNHALTHSTTIFTPLHTLTVVRTPIYSPTTPSRTGRSTEQNNRNPPRYIIPSNQVSCLTFHKYRPSPLVCPHLPTVKGATPYGLSHSRFTRERASREKEIAIMTEVSSTRLYLGNLPRNGMQKSNNHLCGPGPVRISVRWSCL